jgi:hypothetical protein
VATWTSGDNKFKYHDWHSAYEKDTHDYWTWEYQTTADVLSLTQHEVAKRDAYMGGEIEPRENRISYDPSQAHALYKCIRHWLKVYEGSKKLAALDSEIEEITDKD